MPIPAHLDARVMLFSAALAALVIGATGLLRGSCRPVRPPLQRVRSGGRSITSGNSRLRRGLVVAQVSLCFLLLSRRASSRAAPSSVAQVPRTPATHWWRSWFDVQRESGPAERRAFLDAFDARMRANGRVRGIGYTRRPTRAAASASGAPAIRPRRAGPPMPSPSRRLFRRVGCASASRTGAERPKQARPLRSSSTRFIRRSSSRSPSSASRCASRSRPEEKSAPRHVTIVGVASTPGSGGDGRANRGKFDPICRSPGRTISSRHGLPRTTQHG